MPRFFKKGYGGAPAGPKSKVTKKSSNPRRRLQPAAATLVGAMAAAAGAKRVYNRVVASNKEARRIAFGKAKRNYNARLEASDNITTSAPVVIGKQRELSFQEKIARAERPPLLFKRQYAFNAECASGRKAWFSMDVNIFNGNDLQADITGWKAQMTTDGVASDPQISGNSVFDGARFYVDKHTEKIRMINSSSNSITGKVHLYAVKRDNDNNYSGVPITPVNLMLYYSTNGVGTQANGSGGEQTVGRGWAFDTTTAGSNYLANYNMVGSSTNTTGVCASTDCSLTPTSAHIKDRMGYWFRKVSTSEFSLKAGQQFNSSFIFNDLPEIFREQTDYVHIAGISYHICVEFQGGIVGDATATTGDGVVSLGSCQLSVIRENIRLLGLKNQLKSKIIMQTLPLTQIAIAQQVSINPDTGVSDQGVEIDT